MPQIAAVLRCLTFADKNPILHYRPAQLVAELYHYFPNTKMVIIRSIENSANRNLPQTVDARSLIELAYAVLEDGEKIVIETEGKSAVLALIILKVILEHLHLYNRRRELFNRIAKATIEVEDPDRQSILDRLKSDWAPYEPMKAVATLNERLHSLTVHLLPCVARYFGCQLQLSYPLPDGSTAVCDTMESEGHFISSVLDDSPAAGTKITVRAYGERDKEAVSALEGILDNLKMVDEWIRREMLPIEDVATIEKVIELTRGYSKRRVSPPADRVSVRQLISGDMMIISHEITEMKSAIDALCALHSVSIPKIASSLISKQVEKRELQSSTLLTELGKAGVAVPHARFPQLPTRLSVALGLFPNGLFWRKGDEEEDRLVRVVFLCLVDSDYPNTYLDYLSKLARIFRTFKGLDEQIVSAKSVDDVLEIIGDSELSCDSGSL